MCELPACAAERLRFVPDAESLVAHLALEKTKLERADDELWQAYRRIADAVQSIQLQFSWLRRKACPWAIVGLSAAVVSPWLALLIWWWQKGE
jgi:hypothetical protein